MIDFEVQKELRERFNPEGSNLRDRQLKMLEMLTYLDEICKENDIKYWLGAGNLLGAVRHGEYIPWDDDVDIEMLREDYEKLIKILESETTYNLQTYKNDPYYLYSFSKLRDPNSIVLEDSIYDKCLHKGIFIDILVIEKNNLLFAWFAEWVLCRFLLPFTKNNKHVNERFFQSIKKIYFKFLMLLRFCAKLFVNKKYRYGYGVGFHQYLFDTDDIFPLSEIKFEGLTFNAPKNPDAYLKRMYGDYMKLPDFDKIRSHGSAVVFL